MSKGIRSTTVGEAWLVWDGFGGHVFDVCETKADAKRVRAFYNGRPTIVRLPLRRVEWMDESDSVSEPPDARPEVDE